MNNYYLDVEKKLKFHKENILKEFIAKGVYPDNNLINSRLSSIDMHLSIFNHHNSVVGETFDTDEYNNNIKLIYNDLKILYAILHYLSTEEYNKQRCYIESYINEMDSIVKTYKERADFETSSTTLGKTLLFQNNEFKVNENNSVTTFKLKDFRGRDASRISCIANIEGIKSEDIIFKISNEDTNLIVPPYNLTNDTITLLGKKEANTYSYMMQEDQKIEGTILMDIGITANSKNNYTVFAGKNKVSAVHLSNLVKDIIDVPSVLGGYISPDKVNINFYVIGGGNASFKFNKKPISTNFPIDNLKVENLNEIHHFFIEADKDFSFEIELDKGEVYAIKEKGIVQNGKLYYANTEKVRTFNIIEELQGKERNYSAEMIIYNNNTSDYKINSIIIKEQEEIG